METTLIHENNVEGQGFECEKVGCSAPATRHFVYFNGKERFGCLKHGTEFTAYIMQKFRERNIDVRYEEVT